MTKKILIYLLILIILAASTTPAMAKKLPEPNGNGNSSDGNNGNHGQGNNGIDNRNPVNPSPQNNKKIDTTNVNSVGGNDQHGFDDSGYNRNAGIFNGTAMQWCMEKFDDVDFCEVYLGEYANDKLIMKWNAEWDRGNEEGWAHPPYDAWENNQWNGRVPGGSGEVWHYKIVWIGDCGPDGTPLPNGGYCLWGQFEVLTDHGSNADRVHEWLAHAMPSGYGSYP